MKKTELMKYIQEYDKHSHATPAELKDKKHTFFQNLEKWNCINRDKTYDLMKYSRIDCEQDCRVLNKGLEKWYELFKEVDNIINVYNVNSLPMLIIALE